ncbi:hypothetical protein C2845_PM13G11090 [Panicum miliaceum]|uniref:Uncharacterized protein n=1 Tax=Panicum miliaceum TaxID=4540 RepID=A0A3L6RP23_PANMI|nr:hypothetical protein C2845_PM13G11090 [Panicum miliaceum]
MLAGRVVDAVIDWRESKLKPWRGPLPKRRSSPRMSLGDIWVKDFRSGNHAGGARLADFQEMDERSTRVTMAAGEAWTGLGMTAAIDGQFASLGLIGGPEFNGQGANAQSVSLTGWVTYS